MTEILYVSMDAAGVEHAVAGPDDLLDGDAPPAPVEAHGHQPVHQVVDRRDPVEHPLHALGREAAGLGGHCPHRFACAFSSPSWSSARATTKSTRSPIVSGDW